MFYQRISFKMKKTVICAAFAAMALAACNREEIPAPEANLVYREYKAVVADGISTKVGFGTPSGDKISAYFQVNDEIVLTDEDGSKTATVLVSDLSEGGEATLAGKVEEGVNYTKAFYPASAYNAASKTLSVPAEQEYGSVPVLLNGALSETDTYSFSAADAGSAVVCYTLTGDISVKKAYLYYKDEATFWSDGVKENNIMKPDHTLNFSEPLQLGAEPQKIYFVVPVEYDDETQEIKSKAFTLEVVSDAPENAFGVSDYSYFRRKNSLSASIKDGKRFIDFPEIALNSSELTDTERIIWQFGSENGGDCGWVTNDNGADNTDGTIDGNSSADHATVTMGYVASKDNFRADFVYNQDFSVNIGTYRFVAIKSTVPDLIAGRTLPEGVSLDKSKGNPTIKFDITGLGQWRYSQNYSVNNFTTATPDCTVYAYDMLVHFAKEKNLAPTTAPFESKGNFQFKIADFGLSASTVTPTYDVYWIGFFNSIEEIQAFIDETEN